MAHIYRSRQTCTQASAAVTGAPAPVFEQKPFKWGADMRNLGIAVGVATALWFIPPPSGVTLQAWHLLAVFIGTIVGIITKPLPLGAVAMLGLGASMLTKTLTFAQAFSAFASEIPCVPMHLFPIRDGVSDLIPRAHAYLMIKHCVKDALACYAGG